MALAVITVNLNGIHAAYRREFLGWLETSDTDMLPVQGTHTPEEISREIMSETWRSVWAPCCIRGCAGVDVAMRCGRAVLEDESRLIPDEVKMDMNSGRRLEAIACPEGSGTPMRVTSAYFHSGKKDTPKQETKMTHLPRTGARMAELIARETGGGISSLVCGDLNVMRSEINIENWRPNHNKYAGALDEEIAFPN